MGVFCPNIGLSAIQSMSDFFQVTSFETDNGEVVDQQTSPIIEIKKLNGQGTLYKLTDADIESINAQRESNGIVNVEKLIRSTRSNFGSGQYVVSAIGHSLFPPSLKDLGMIRVEVNSNIEITSDNYTLGEVESHEVFIVYPEGSIFDLDSWYGFVAKMREDEEISDNFLTMATEIVKQVTEQTAELFENTKFEKHLSYYDKLCISRNRVYD